MSTEGFSRHFPYITLCRPQHCATDVEDEGSLITTRDFVRFAGFFCNFFIQFSNQEFISLLK